MEFSVQQFSRCTDTPAPGVGEEESRMRAERSQCVSRQEAPLTTGKDLGFPSRLLTRKCRFQDGGGPAPTSLGLTTSAAVTVSQLSPTASLYQGLFPQPKELTVPLGQCRGVRNTRPSEVANARGRQDTVSTPAALSSEAQVLWGEREGRREA